MNTKNIILDIKTMSETLNEEVFYNILNYALKKDICFVFDNENLLDSNKYDSINNKQNICSLNSSDFVIKTINYYDCDKMVIEELRTLQSQGKHIVATNIDSDGKLLKLDEYHEKLLRNLSPWETTFAWAIKWVKTIKEVEYLLVSPKSIDEINIYLNTLKNGNDLNNSEWNFMIDIANILKDSK